MKNTKIKKVTLTAIMAAMSAILMFLEIPLRPIFPDFLKLDISDLPAIVCAFAIGPIWGIAVELIKNIVHMSASQSAMIGEVANFIVGASFILPAGIIYRKVHTKKGALIGLSVGILSMVLAGIIANYFITLPLYFESASPAQKISIILYGITPFNIFKGIVISLITLFIYKPLSPLLHRK